MNRPKTLTAAGCLLLIGAVAVLSAQGVLFSTANAAERPVDKDLTVEQAQQRIEQGEELDTIPRSVWRKLLGNQEYEVMWEDATERPFTGDLLHNSEPGVYVTAGCRIPVFRSDHKFKSGTGWPSFWEVFDKENIILKEDRSWGMRRVEVESACGEHLGHVFDDGPEPTGLRYCINSAALDFVPASEFDFDGAGVQPIASDGAQAQ